MTAEQVCQLVSKMEQERDQARQVRKIVSCLMAVLNIPEGNHLVMAFGDGHERDNREALETWVNYMLPELDMDEVEGRLEMLCRQVKSRMGIFLEVER